MPEKSSHQGMSLPSLATLDTSPSQSLEREVEDEQDAGIFRAGA